MCRDLWNWQTKNPLGYDTPGTDTETVIEEKVITGVVEEPTASAAGAVHAKKGEDEAGDKRTCVLA